MLHPGLFVQRKFLFPQNKEVQVLGHIGFFCLFFFFLQIGQILFLSGYNLFTVL